jgi:membrane protein
MVAIIGLVFGHATAQREVIRQVQMLVGTQGAKAIEALLHASRNTTHGTIATIIGMVTLLFGASGVMIELRDALNTIWEVPTPQLTGIRSRITSYIKERLFSFAMLLSIGFILVVSLVVSTWISALGAVSASLLPSIEALLQLVDALVSFAVITGLFAAIYKIMPMCELNGAT